MFVAVDLGFLPAVSLLLKRRANPNAKEFVQGECPLHVAAHRKDAAVARLLLDARADVGIRRLNDGFTHGENFQELAEAMQDADVIALLSDIQA